MTTHRIAPMLGALTVALAIPAMAAAQDAEKSTTAERPKEGFASREALNAHYYKLAMQNRRRQMDDLTALAAKQSGQEAEATYRQILNEAILGDEYEAAEKAAEAYLESHKEPTQTRALAGLVDMMAAERRGEHKEARERLQSFLKAPATERFEPGLLLAVAEPVLQGLIREGRFEEARQFCRLLVDESGAKPVQEHFGTRLARIEMLGKPAPAISGTDIDGEKVSLADMQGKVVLVNFWATWCPPCAAEAPALKDIHARYKDRGFRILGVNLDAAREGAGDAKRDRAAVRRFLINFGIDWPNVLNTEGTGDIARSYGVTEIPTTFLIDRDGKIAQVDQAGEDLERNVSQFFEDKDTGKDKVKKDKAEAAENAKDRDGESK